MADDVSTPTQTPTKREMLLDLMSQVQDDQNKAVIEAVNYFKGPEASSFKETLVALQKRTVPASQFDQVFSAIISVFDSMVKLINDAVPNLPGVNTNQSIDYYGTGTSTTTSTTATTDTSSGTTEPASEPTASETTEAMENTQNSDTTTSGDEK